MKSVKDVHALRTLVFLLVVLAPIASGCRGSGRDHSVAKCVRHNTNEVVKSHSARDIIRAGCASLKNAGDLPDNGRADVYAACVDPPEEPCYPAPGMTEDELKRALAGAHAAGLLPISVAGRVNDLGVALSTGHARSSGDGPSVIGDEALDRFASNEGFLDGGFTSKSIVVCDVNISFTGGTGNGQARRAKKLQKVYADALAKNCAGGAVDLQAAAEVLRGKGVSVRAVLAGEVALDPSGLVDAKPTMEIKVQGSERLAKQMVEKWSATRTSPSVERYGRAESSGRLFMYSVIDARYRAAADQALDAALVAMLKQ